MNNLRRIYPTSIQFTTTIRKIFDTSIKSCRLFHTNPDGGKEKNNVDFSQLPSNPRKDPVAECTNEASLEELEENTPPPLTTATEYESLLENHSTTLTKEEQDMDAIIQIGRSIKKARICAVPDVDVGNNTNWSDAFKKRKPESTTANASDFIHPQYRNTHYSHQTKNARAIPNRLAKNGYEEKMNRLLKENGKDSMMNDLKKLILNGTASTGQYNLGIKKLCQTSNQARDLIDQMTLNNIPITEIILDALIHKLLLEGKVEAAQNVIDNDFTQHKLQPTISSARYMNDAELLRGTGQQTELKRLLQQSSSSSLKYLHALIANGKATPINCNFGMYYMCKTSYEIRAMISQMNYHQIPITDRDLNVLIKKLLFENNREAAQLVYDKDFVKYGLLPDKHTKKAMASATKLAGIGRDTKMIEMLSKQGKQYTKEYLKEMIRNGKADSRNCIWGMRKLCTTSEDIRDLINDMNKMQGMTTENAIPENMLAVLMDKLVAENKRNEAQDVLDIEFQNYRLKPTANVVRKMKRADEYAAYEEYIRVKSMASVSTSDSKTIQETNSTNNSTTNSTTNSIQEIQAIQTQDKKDTQKLSHLLKTKGKKVATSHFRKGKMKNKIKTSHCVWAMKNLYNTSTMVRALMETMFDRNILLNEEILNTLMYKLYYEDKEEEAQQVYDADFLKYKFVTNENTFKVMVIKDKLKSNGYMDELKRLQIEDQKGKTEALLYYDRSSNVRMQESTWKRKEREAREENGLPRENNAMNYLIEKIQEGKVNRIHCMWGAKELCATSKETLLLIQKMNHAIIPVDIEILNILITQYLSENDIDKAQDLFTKGFQKYNLKPNAVTMRIMATFITPLSIQYTTEMIQLLRDEQEQSTIH